MTARTIYIRWSNNGQHIRKWDWSEFDLAERLIAETVTVSDPKAEALADALRLWRQYDNMDEADFSEVGPMLHYAKAIEATRAALAAWEGK